MRQRTLYGPNGLRIELDRDAVIPDDPGADTPAMVYYLDASGTYWCVNDTGELWGDRERYTLTDRQNRWLDEQMDEVNSFLYGAEEVA